MAMLAIGDYRPDVSDLNQAYTKSVLNVTPQADGYGPFKGVNPFTEAMPDDCRGVFFARNADGSVTIFAGTSRRLYRLNNTDLNWTDVSKGATNYSALDNNALWTFAQFNNVVIACQANSVPQAYTLGVSSAFADLGGSPPQAAYVAVVNRFLVLSGLLNAPRRVQWSGLNAITTWTSGVTYSDSQDMPDGGNVKGVVGGEFGVILQDTAIRRMTYAPGADIIFQIDRLARDVGCAFPYSIVDAEGLVFFYSTKGFMMVSGDGTMRPIGKERVDRTFLDSVDSGSPRFVQGATKPDSNLILFVYKGTDYSGNGFNRGLVYDLVLDRWAPVAVEGHVIASMAKPGLTLESLGVIGSVSITNAANNGSGLIRLTVGSTAGWTTGDYKDVVSVGGTVEANGSWIITVVNGTTIDLQGSTFTNAYTSGGYVAGSVDDLTVSFDDISAATLTQLGLVDVDHKLGYFTGANLEATLETSEQSGISKRIFIRGYWPVTDAANVLASTGRRENLNIQPVYSDELPMTALGYNPQRVSTRHARGRFRIPSGTEWTFFSGAEPDFTQEGGR